MPFGRLQFRHPIRLPAHYRPSGPPLPRRMPENTACRGPPPRTRPVLSTISEPPSAGRIFGCCGARAPAVFQWCRTAGDDDSMTTPPWPADVLVRAGLPAADVAAWAAAAAMPGGHGGFPASVDSVSQFLGRGLALRQRLPARGHGTAAEQAARDTIGAVLHEARKMFLRAYTADLYDQLTSGRTQPLRVADLLAGAAARVPGLVPSTAELAAE